jgi:RNA polymerase sigma factor (sigma-70 family)
VGEDARGAVEHAYRHEWARVFAATTRVARDLDLAEDSVQEAFSEALTSWSRDGVPRNPGAWLTTTAQRRAIDSLRRASTHRAKVQLLIEPEQNTDEGSPPMNPAHEHQRVVDDDTMRLLFMCCHPSLSSDSQMALTLRLVCGMTTPDIARCFLVSEPTMAARLTRAKRKITLARIPFRVPEPDELPARLDAALAVVYLLFTIGHTAPTGDTLVRGDVANEALRLARLLHELMPGQQDVQGLLALVLVTDARRESRLDGDGQSQRISEQDRSLWDQEMISEAHELVALSARSGSRGRYTLQAAIASHHAEAPSYDDVDWVEIVRLYDELLVVWPSPVVELNRAVALSKTSGPEVALDVVERLESEGRLDRYQYLPAIKAYFLDQLGRVDEAERARVRAFELAGNDVERDFLARQRD